jgi:hypothetical protein
MNRKQPRDIGFDESQSMHWCGIPIAIFFAICQELIVESIDLACLIGRDILQMQGIQLALCWLIIVTIANRLWSFVKWRGLCRSAAYKQ